MDSDLPPKTIQKDVHNMWALGGEFIRDIHNKLWLEKEAVECVTAAKIVRLRVRR
jgi:hypothetical protein